MGIGFADSLVKDAAKGRHGFLTMHSNAAEGTGLGLPGKWAGRCTHSAAPCSEIAPTPRPSIREFSLLRTEYKGQPDGSIVSCSDLDLCATNFFNASVRGTATIAPIRPRRKAQPTSDSVISRKETFTASFMKNGVTMLSTIKLVKIRPQATSKALFQPNMRRVTKVGGISAIRNPKVGMKSRKKYRKAQTTGVSTPTTNRKIRLTRALMPALL